MVTGNCKEYIPGVYSQGNEPNCTAIACTQMVQGALVMSGKAHRDLVLSPQGIIDIPSINTNPRMVKGFCQKAPNDVDCENGLEEERFYQFTNISRRLPDHRAFEVFQTPRPERYRLSDIHLYRTPETIKDEICKLYESGLKYPCVAGVKMCGFDNEVARKVARGEYVDPVTGKVGALYRPTEAEIHDYDASTPTGHTLLVVGVNTDFEDEADHYCEVKNSWGEEWGDGGYSKIPFDLISFVYVPEP